MLSSRVWCSRVPCASLWGSPDRGARHMSSWGIRMELLRIAMRGIAHSTRGRIQSGRHSTFSGYFTFWIPSADISHPDGRGGRFNFPVQTCLDPLIGYFTSGYLTTGWERRTFQLPRSDMSRSSNSTYPESFSLSIQCSGISPEASWYFWPTFWDILL